jgi:hypothetical protein
LTRIEVVAPLESIELLVARLSTGDATREPNVTSPIGYRPGITERVPLGHVELVQVFVEFAVGVGSAAAYDLVKKALEGEPVHRVKAEDEEPEDEEPEDA